ncbi:Glycosyltransferase involved in cell wall bisynthesis [Candidatus Nitrotoga sp. HW29]|uniref:glycosyltransferase family 4 protein n=1 Tax=Candidatus Nitrotoga sp. HW29 TaxID=2886963 RepID=UPI001EF2E0F7|nr:glycosyltransferase family 4 protein [Candidatus Nitrotoga sp. HW29]CAH1906377.1 Glycosyltransferase involved in cell wall bisynthesis [Candidatus Nitrotoga sp. HW29]
MRIQDLKIALVGPLPPPAGGMANQTRQLATLLKQEGVNVELVPVNAPYRPHFVSHIKGLRAVFRLLPYLLHLWRVAGRVDLFHIMANSGWSWHLFAAPAVWAAKFRGKAVLVNYRGGEADDFFTRAFTWVQPTLKRTNIITVPSGFLKKIFADRNFNTHIVPNIVNLSRFIPNHTRKQNLSAPHIVVARNLEPLYDNTSALGAFSIVRKAIPDAHLTIAGSGPERAKLETIAKELGVADAVVFAGQIDNEHMPALYREADIALNPSLADNMPISILEALASGVPVVSTDVGGIPFLVENGKTALLVPPRNPERMAEAVLLVLRDESLRERMIKDGLDHAHRFAWESVRGELFLAYRMALDGATLAVIPDGK